MAAAAEEYRPRQYAREGGIVEVDFRSMAKSHDKSAIPNRDATHASGGKRKRTDDEEAQPEEGMAVDAGAPGGATGTDVPLNKRRAYDNVSGKVSSRPWKANFGRASSASAGVLPATDWEAKMRDKAAKKAIQEHVAAAHKEARDKAVAEKKRREEVKARREANRKAAQVVQKITNPKTLLKLNKKKAKKLVAVNK